MFEYLDAEPEQDPTLVYSEPVPIRDPLGGGLVLRGVRFSYGDSPPVLDGVNLQVPEGARVAVIGASGSGKTTLLRLLARFERPDAGQILVGGRAYESVSLADFRRQVGVVWQEVGLVRGTIRENIALGSLDVDFAAVQRAARLARVAEVIEALPQGYETPVAEWGISLSGGQRQRIAIARALARRARIVLLDEATANVDAVTEYGIVADLTAAARDSTVIYVTHRLSLTPLADLVCLVEGGGVAAVGPHEELLERSERYAALWHGERSADISDLLGPAPK